MVVKLNEHITYKKILKIVFLPICLMLFSALYGIVDGFCVSTFVGADHFAGINLIYPVIFIVGQIGLVFGSGGSALISKYLGEKNKDGANRVFTNLLKTIIILGIFVSVIVSVFIKPIVNSLASYSSTVTETTKNVAITYGIVLIIAQFLYMLQVFFSIIFMADENSKIGFLFTLLGGGLNIILDFLFVGLFKLGVMGAAVATIIGYIGASIGPLIYYIKHKDRNFRFIKCKYDVKEILQSAFNGISEFTTNISSQIMSIILNICLLKIFGQNGISCYGGIMYTSFIFASILFGFSGGISPYISYNYGAQNTKELQNIFKKVVLLILIIDIGLFVLCFSTARPLSYVFASKNQEIADMTYNGLRLFSFTFIVIGYGIFSSSFFTALNNGLVSGIVSILRSFVFPLICLLVFSSLIENNVIDKHFLWLNVDCAELLSAIAAFIFFFALNKKYHYIK